MYVENYADNQIPSFVQNDRFLMPVLIPVRIHSKSDSFCPSRMSKHYRSEVMTSLRSLGVSEMTPH